MDTGHYNCRDYYLIPHFAPTTITNERYPLNRHESFDELEQRSRSPASQKPKFPLLDLPLELRQHILSFVLPHTQEFRDSGGLGEHVRNFSAVKKRYACGMLPASQTRTKTAAAAATNVVWKRGTTSILAVCKQLHDECAAMIYGTNTFLLFVTFNRITFRFRWLLPSGLAPSRSFEILDTLNKRYMRLIKKVVINVDVVDSYTGMIKFNVSGKGLAHGLRRQVQQLVNALREAPRNEDMADESTEVAGERRLTRVAIRVSNGNVVLDQIKSEIVKQREGGIKVAEDLEEILEPFGDLRGVRNVSIGGAVTSSFAHDLQLLIQSEPPMGHSQKTVDVEDEGLSPTPNTTSKSGIPLCVYGNDL